MINNNCKMCIYCPVARNFIIKYRKSSFHQEQDYGKQDLLEIILNKCKKENINGLCVKHIQSIIFQLNSFFHIRKNYTNELSTLNQNDIELIAEINNTFLENEQEEQIERTIQEKEWDEEIKSILNNVEKNWTKEHLEEIGICIEKNTEETENNAKEIYVRLSEIIDKYTDTSENTKYVYCNFNYSNHKFLENKDKDKKIDIYKLRNCNTIQFIEVTKKIIFNKSTTLSAFSTHNQKIIYKYLENAPKDAHFIFRQLIGKPTLAKKGSKNSEKERLKLTDTDVAILMYNDNNKKNKVQNLYKTDLPKNSIENILCQSDIKKISRIFLVSENVFTCGIGKSYGTWKIAINENKNEQFKNHLLTDEDINTQNKAKQIKTPYIVREKIFNKIKEFIEQTDDNFNKMISENPEFFCEEDICLFTYEKDGKEYYDYELMYKNLLHPEDFDTLLSVLEELQAQENN